MFTDFWLPTDAEAYLRILKVCIRELQRPLMAYNTLTVTVNGATAVQHLLGRQPLGWIITDKTGYGDIKRNSWNTTTITLESASAVTCTILIF